MDIKSKDYSEYYKRQLSISSFGAEMQERLANSKCLIVGMGGLGCPAALYLSVSGIGTLGLCDYDLVEFSNLSRQVLFSLDDENKAKAEQAAKILQEKNPFIKVVPHNVLLNEKNAEAIIANYDIVLDCTDNFHVKYLIHDVCLKLKKDLIQASLFQTQGQVISFAFSKETFQGCMRCLWQEEPSPGCVQSCAEAGILSVVAGTVAMRQATTAVQNICGNYTLAGYSSLYTYQKQEWLNLAIPVTQSCTCGKRSHKIAQESLEIETIDPSYLILDVRNEEHQNNAFKEYQFQNVSAAQLNDLSLLATALDKNKHYVCMCYGGIRSLDTAQKLRKLGFTKVHSYAKGYKRFSTVAK